VRAAGASRSLAGLANRRNDQVSGLPLQEVLDVLDGAEQDVADDLGRLPRIVPGADHVRQGEDRVVGASGSWWKTSSPAPKILRSLRAARSASRSTSAPRPVLTRMAVGFISASSFRPRKFRVSGLRRM